MKKVLCFVLSVVLFSVSFSFVSSQSAFATVDLSKINGFVDKDITVDGLNTTFLYSDIIKYVCNLYNSYADYVARKIEAFRSAYFYFMLTNYLSCSSPLLNSNSTTFSDDYLEFYWNYYWEAVSGSLDYYHSDFDIFLIAGGFNDVPFSVRGLSFYDLNVDVYNQPGELISNTRKDFFNYYQTYLARFLLENNFSGVTDPNPGKSGLDIAPGYVSSDELVESIEKDNSLFLPKNAAAKISYRTDNHFQQYVNAIEPSRTDTYTPVIEFSSCFFGGGADDVYFTLFYDDGTSLYNSEYQFHFYFENVTDTSGNDKKCPRLKVWNNIDGSEDTASEFLSSTVDFTSVKYIRIVLSTFSSSYFYAYGYKTITDFLNNRNSVVASKSNFNSYTNLLTTDLSSSSAVYGEYLSKDSSHKFEGSWEYHDESCIYDGNDDIGLFVSSSPIAFTYSGIIDTTKIPANQIITVNGDTIYNYTITNPDTGESSSVGDYITNNYTYITNNYGDSGSSSGSGVAGNVTVGGSIDVGGSVGVDINVNVPDININVSGTGSGAGGSGSSIANPDDFTSADEVDLTKYYDNAIEQSTGFQKFLKDFFGFLPAELLGLILFAVAMAIICRVFGR